jgi:hypothetical protein
LRYNDSDENGFRDIAPAFALSLVQFGIGTIAGRKLAEEIVFYTIGM